MCNFTEGGGDGYIVYLAWVLCCAPHPRSFRRALGIRGGGERVVVHAGDRKEGGQKQTIREESVEGGGYINPQIFRMLKLAYIHDWG